MTEIANLGEFGLIDRLTQGIQLQNTSTLRGVGDDCAVLRYSNNPEDSKRVLVTTDMLMEGIRHGTVNPFLRKVISQDGTIRNEGGNIFTPYEILHMDWLCSNVIGSIPAFEDLSAKAQEITRLQGIYRDQIPPEKAEGQREIR